MKNAKPCDIGERCEIGKEEKESEEVAKEMKDGARPRPGS
jgi:hypothetical protein